MNCRDPAWRTCLIYGDERQVEQLPCDGIREGPGLAQDRPPVVLLAIVPTLAPAHVLHGLPVKMDTCTH